MSEEVELTAEHHPLASHIYLYEKGNSYKKRSKVLCCLTVTFSGDKMFISGVHEGKIHPSVRRAVARVALQLGVELVEWEHNGIIHSGRPGDYA